MCDSVCVCVYVHEPVYTSFTKKRKIKRGGLEFKDAFCTRDKKHACKATCRCMVGGTYDGTAAKF